MLPHHVAWFSFFLDFCGQSLSVSLHCSSQVGVCYLKSGLQSLSSSQIDNSLVLDILRSYTELTLRGKSIVLCWIPSHVGIKGNDKADTVAKAAINSNISSNKICTKDILPQISKLCLDKWQQNWNSCTNNKLNSIKPATGETARSRLNRRDSVIINRLRMGHIRLTHSYLLTRWQPHVGTGAVSV